MSKIRVLVVDDLAFMRNFVSEIINVSPVMEVIDQARDMKEAQLKINHFRPDVVVMDIEIAKINWFEDFERIIRNTTTPIIVLSKNSQAGNVYALRALEKGAVDFVYRPPISSSIYNSEIAEELRKKVIVAASAKNDIAEIKDNLGSRQIAGSLLEREYEAQLTMTKLIVIGTSTGGPKALNEVIPKIPSVIKAAIMIVQHMPPGFTKTLAERLNAISAIKVKEAEQNEYLLPGYAYIAPGDYHLTINSTVIKHKKVYTVGLNKEEPRGRHRPSVDVLFESAANNYAHKTIGVLMTGMGSDGAQGLAKIKDSGGITIAEHQSTCVVYGMPKVAIESGKVDIIAPLPEIADEIIKNM